MIRFYTLLFLISAIAKLGLGQSITCPPDREVQCYESFISDPVISEADGLELTTSLEYFGNSCDTFDIKAKYSLSDSQEVASCFTTLTVLPFMEQILFPEDTTLSGVRLSEVLNQPLFTEQMFPRVIGECNIEFSFKDIVVESFPVLNVFRNWTATNLCTGTQTIVPQHIKLIDLPNQSIRTQVADCRGNKLIVDSLSISINGRAVDFENCIQPYDSLYQIVNCVAAENNISNQDELEITLHNILDPLSQLSTYDILVIQRHIIGFERFTDDCLLTAADVNRDGKVNGIDLVELRKFILGIYSEWPAAYGYKPLFIVNDVERTNLRFNTDDFPLEDLRIVLSKQGDVDLGN